MRRSAISMVLLAFLALPTGATPAAIALGRGESPINEGAEMWLDADPALGIDDVRMPASDSRFSAAAGRMTWVGMASPVAWLRFSLSASPEAGRASYIEVRPSFSIILDRVELYLPRIDGGYDRLIAGAKEAPLAGERHSRFFVFPLPPTALEGREIYLRAASSTDVEFRVYAMDEAVLARKEGLESGAYGIILGVLVAMALYSFFLFASLRDRAYFFYASYILTAAAWIFMVQGHSRNVFGSSPGLDQSLLWLFAGSMISLGAAFSSAFLRLRGNRPILFALLMLICAISAVAAVAGFLGAQRLAFLVTNALGGILSLFLILTSISRIAQGFGPARYFLAAWTVLAVSGLSFVLMNVKILPVSFWTVNSMPLGMAAESILLSMALADRFKRLEREKAALERNQERLRKLSLTDHLTGLCNKRFLVRELESEAGNARLLGGELSLIFLDIDDFKAVNDRWGHAFGDEVLVALSAAIRSSIRDSDSPCRYGGEEFVVIMPGADLDEAFQAAERIRERFASASRRSPTGEESRSSVSLGAASLLPGESPAQLLTRADKAMYEAKRLGKNRTVRG